MKKQEIGKTNVGSATLVYYAYDCEDNCGVSIVKTETESSSGTVSGSMDSAVSLANVLFRNTVFPENLSEVLEDYNYPA